MDITRREMLMGSGVALAGGAMLHYAGKVNAGEVIRDERRESMPAWQQDSLDPGVDYVPVITPNNVALDYRIVEGVKVFHLIAEPVSHEFAPGIEGNCWGYNGRVHGPTIEAVEGDRVRIYVTNRLKASTSLHWHGVLLPSGMDGVGGLSQQPIKPGETFKYEWTFHQHGTLIYHPHHDEMVQMAMGQMGMLIVHPRNPNLIPSVDRDFALLLSEWQIKPGTARPNVDEMVDFNILTINAKAFPGTDSLIVQQNDRVRIRVANLSAMSHHSFHIHGHAFRIAGTDGGRIPEAGQWPETTVIVPTGSTRDLEFVADNPGDWACHCHMTHHVHNQMGHGFPNMIGMDPSGFDERVRRLLPDYMTMGQHGMADHGKNVEAGHMAVPVNSIPMIGAQGPRGYITMGGMFTILKVREHIEDYDTDPGWYDNPPGTEAKAAEAADLRRDGIRG